MSLYIIRRNSYTVYLYGSLMVIHDDAGLEVKRLPRIEAEEGNKFFWLRCE